MSDEFEFDDDLFGDDDEFGDFEDDDAGFSFDDDDDFGSFDDIDSFDDIGDNEGFFDDDEDLDEERSGPSRTFVILAGFMMLLFAIALIVVVLLAVQPDEDGPFEMTSTAVAIANATRIQQLAETQTQQAIDQVATETQAVIDMQASETAVIVQQTETAEANIAATASAEADLTATAEALSVQQTANAEGTAGAQPTPTPTEDLGAVTQAPAIDIEGTATAIAESLLTPVISETEEGGTGGGDPTRPPSQLPETGLLDSTTGRSGFSLLAFLAVGLVGIIVGARRMRSLNQ